MDFFTTGQAGYVKIARFLDWYDIRMLFESHNFKEIQNLEKL